MNSQNEFEKSVLGAVFLDPSSLDDVLPLLAPNDFAGTNHQAIYTAIKAMAESGSPIDLVTMTASLKDAGQLELAGGTSYLSELVDFVPTAANVGYYVRKVRGESARRKTETLLVEELSRLKGGDSLSDVQERVEATFLLMSADHKGGPQLVASVLPKLMEQVDHSQKSPGRVNGLETGYSRLDQSVGGLRGGDLVIVAGRPSMGKTAFTLNIAENVAGAGKQVAFFSLEMTRIQLTERLVFGRAEVDSVKARIGKLESNDIRRILGAAESLHAVPLHIDDTSALSVFQLRSHCRRMKRKGGVDLIIVDYLQLMRGSGDSRVQEIGNISRSLKALAKELDVPVIALSQLNRSLESRTEKRPTLSDLRDSGEIEQDADLVWMLYRDVVYNKKANPREAELNMAKNRRGPCGTVRLYFDAQFTRFTA